MWPWIKRWRDWAMNDLWPMYRIGPQPQALHHSYEKAGLTLHDQPIPWNAEAVLVEALLRLPAAAARRKADFHLRIPGQDPVQAVWPERPTPAWPERPVLEGALTGWLDLLRKEAARRILPPLGPRPVLWKELYTPSTGRSSRTTRYLMGTVIATGIGIWLATVARHLMAVGTPLN